MLLLPEIGVLLILIGVWMVWAFGRWQEWLPQQATGSAPREKAATGPNLSVDLRDRIRQECKSSVDFEAFCLDYFPAVHRRFSPGMERVQMETLLILHASAEEIEVSLRGRRESEAKAGG
jgi:hypothetical protein